MQASNEFYKRYRDIVNQINSDVIESRLGFKRADISPYSAANISSHLPDDISKLKDSGITLRLWIEEKDADEEITL